MPTEVPKQLGYAVAESKWPAQLAPVSDTESDTPPCNKQLLFPMLFRTRLLLT